MRIRKNGGAGGASVSIGNKHFVKPLIYIHHHLLPDHHAISNGGAEAAEKPPPPESPTSSETRCVINKSPWDVTQLVLAFCNFTHHQLVESKPMKIEEQEQEECVLKTDLNGDRSRCTTPAAGRRCRREPGEKDREFEQSLASFSKSRKLIRDSGNEKTSAGKKIRREMTSGKSAVQSLKVKKGRKRQIGGGKSSGVEIERSGVGKESKVLIRGSMSKRKSDDSDVGKPLVPTDKPNRKRRSCALSKMGGGDFYYYSGFGPSRKTTSRRATCSQPIYTELADQDDELDHVNGSGGHSSPNCATNAKINVKESDEHDNAGEVAGRVDIDDDFEDELDDDDDEGVVTRKKRRVKCRSLKSLL